MQDLLIRCNIVLVSRTRRCLRHFRAVTAFRASSLMDDIKAAWSDSVYLIMSRLLANCRPRMRPADRRSPTRSTPAQSTPSSGRLSAREVVGIPSYGACGAYLRKSLNISEEGRCLASTYTEGRLSGIITHLHYCATRSCRRLRPCRCSCATADPSCRGHFSCSARSIRLLKSLLNENCSNFTD